MERRHAHDQPGEAARRCIARYASRVPGGVDRAQNQTDEGGRDGRHLNDRKADEAVVEPEGETRTSRGTLRVVDNDQGGAESRTLYGKFKQAGWTPGGSRTEIAWLEYEQASEQRALTWTGSVDTVNQRLGVAGPFGYDMRWAWPAFNREAIDAGTTSVSVLTQTARTLPTAANVVRAIDAVTNKPESASTVTMSRR
jgi:hypothetical protein